MTALVAAVVVGVFVGEVWFRRRRSAEYLRGLLAGQWQSDLTHGVLQLDVTAEPPLAAVPRRRSPDVKVERQPPPMKRPVFHHD